MPVYTYGHNPYTLDREAVSTAQTAGSPAKEANAYQPGNTTWAIESILEPPDFHRDCVGDWYECSPIGDDPPAAEAFDEPLAEVVSTHVGA